MQVPVDDLRILLIQARDTPAIERQELGCFVERTHLPPTCFRTLNVVREPVSSAALSDVHALFIGGAGEYSAASEYPWTADLLELVRAAVARKLPTFGSCWGHQLIARALGGRVEFDPERAEFGCADVALTEAGRRDLLFGALPPRFKANMGHHDRVVSLPPDAVELASNASQPNQAFRISGLPVYGTQFHSELDAAREKERLLAYREHYPEIDTEAEFQAVLDGLAETTEVDGLLHSFLSTFVFSVPEESPNTRRASI